MTGKGLRGMANGRPEASVLVAGAQRVEMSDLRLHGSLSVVRANQHCKNPQSTSQKAFQNIDTTVARKATQSGFTNGRPVD